MIEKFKNPAAIKIFHFKNDEKKFTASDFY